MTDPNILISNGTCYSAPGKKLEGSFIPCGNDAFGHKTCCGAGDNCLADNACFGVHGSGYGSYLTYMAGCSDPDYKDSSCPNKAIDQPWIALTLCDNSDGAWAACSQEGSPSTLQPGSFCSCTDTASATVAFRDATSLSSSCSLPQSTGQSIDFFPGHLPTPSGTTAPASGSGSTSGSGIATQTQTRSTTSSQTGAGNSGTSSPSETGSTTPTQQQSSTSVTGASTSATPSPNSPGTTTLTQTKPTTSPSSAAGLSTNSTPSPTPTSTTSNLSTAAKAGIGAGAALGGLLLLALLFAFLLLRRKRRRTPSETESASASATDTKPSPESSEHQRVSAMSTAPTLTPTAAEADGQALAEADGRAAQPWSLRGELEGSQVVPSRAGGGGSTVGVGAQTGSARRTGELSPVAELPGSGRW